MSKQTKQSETVKKFKPGMIVWCEDGHKALIGLCEFLNYHPYNDGVGLVQILNPGIWHGRTLYRYVDKLKLLDEL